MTTMKTTTAIPQASAAILPPRPVCIVQCGAAGWPAVNGLPAELRGVSYAPLIAKLMPILERTGCRDVVLHNPFGIEWKVDEAKGMVAKYRYSAWSMDPVAHGLARRFAAEWGVVAAGGVRVSAYVGPLALDPIYSGDAGALLYWLWEAVKPLAGVCRCVFHDARSANPMGSKAEVLLRALDVLLAEKGTMSGTETRPRAQDAYLHGLSVFVDEVDWRKFQPPVYASVKQLLGEVYRWPRDGDVATFAGHAEKCRGILKDGHCPVIDMLGCGMEYSVRLVAALGKVSAAAQAQSGPLAADQS